MRRIRILILLISLFSSFSYAVQFSSAKSELCYTKRTIPEKYDIVFNAMKNYLISSNFLLRSGDKESRYLYTEGMIVIGDEHYSIKLSVNFKTKFEGEEEVTDVKITANYKLVEESNKMANISLGSVSFPIPTPWNKEFREKASGNIRDPEFFRGFYYGFYKFLYLEKIDDFSPKKVENKVTKDKVTKTNVENNETESNTTNEITTELNTTLEDNKKVVNETASESNTTKIEKGEKR